jgi:alpha-beta hydrolase superfamily lysophospholipase
MIGGDPAAAPDRFGFAFSPRGRFATSMRTATRRRILERWELTGENPEPRGVRELSADTESRVVPLDDGRILLAGRLPGPRPARYRMELLGRAGPQGGNRITLGEVPAAFGCHLLPAPTGSAGSTGPGGPVLAIAVAVEAPDTSTIWQVHDGAPWLTPLLQVPGILTGGAWAGPDLLALNRTDQAGTTSGILADLTRNSWWPVWQVPGHGTERIALAAPGTGLLILTTHAAGRRWLGWGRPGDGEVHFPEALNPPGTSLRPLAVDEFGERVLLAEQAGATTRLHLHSPSDGTVRPLPGPPCTITGPAVWSGDLVRFGFAAPDRPPTLGALRFGDRPRWSAARTGQQRWVGAALTRVAGATASMEAVVYGGPGWTRSPRLVLALHGGPLSAWTFDFDPVFQMLAGAGVAVLAPNYRGSTGYGPEHRRPVLGDWGGPDLDDVLHLGADLARLRSPRLPPPVLLGASYGAFLALLAACRAAGNWSGAVALAPFLSGPRLHEDSPAEVRARVVELGGFGSTEPDGRARDVLDTCTGPGVPLLLAHGREDHTVPVDQSRTLYRHLHAHGYADCADVTYVEVDGDHTDVLRCRPPRLARAVRDFVLDRTAPAAGPPATAPAAIPLPRG